MMGILNCPFCGCAEIEQIKLLNNVGWYFKCGECRVEQGSYPTYEDAVVAWNRRYSNKVTDVVDRPRWIGVDERLPETWEPVLCWYEYYHYSREKILPEYGIGYCINGRWDGEVSTGTNCRVLAWMPLPEPPKEIHND